MVCACRMSKSMLCAINSVAQQIKFIPFLEFSFNTIAMKADLKVECPSQMSTLIYKNDWNIDDFKQNKDNLFHPMKDYHNHGIYRQEVLQSSKGWVKLYEHIIDYYGPSMDAHCMHDFNFTI